MPAGRYHHTATDFYIAVTVAASGVGQGYLGPVPFGYCWYIRRLSTHGATAASSPLLEIAVVATNALNTNWDRVARQDFTTAPADDIADETPPIYVAPGRFLVGYYSGCNNGDRFVIAAEVDIHELRVSPDDLERVYGEAARAQRRAQDLATIELVRGTEPPPL